MHIKNTLERVEKNAVREIKDSLDWKMNLKLFDLKFKKFFENIIVQPIGFIANLKLFKML